MPRIIFIHGQKSRKGPWNGKAAGTGVDSSEQGGAAQSVQQASLPPSLREGVLLYFPIDPYSLPYHGPFFAADRIFASATEPLFILILTAGPRLCQASGPVLCNLPESREKETPFFGSISSLFLSAAVPKPKNDGVFPLRIVKLYLDFSRDYGIMIAKGNHYGSLFGSSNPTGAFAGGENRGESVGSHTIYNNAGRRLGRSPVNGKEDCHRAIQL